MRAQMDFCYQCGTRLEQRELAGEGIVPYCPRCGAYRFPIYNTAISTALLNPAQDRVLLLQQYGRKDYILLAGYVNRGESAEQALAREVREEVGLTVAAYHYMQSCFFEPSNTLMLNFVSLSQSEDLSGMTEEVDAAVWTPLDRAVQIIKPNGPADFFLRAIVAKLQSGWRLPTP